MLFAALAFSGAIAQDRADTAPPHLVLARELVSHTQRQDNVYQLGARRIVLPADAPGSRYAVTADCSGFMLALFARSGYATEARMGYLSAAATSRRRRPAAQDFVHSIEVEQGFQRISKIDDLRPGDVLAHAMLDAADRRETGTTGHIFLVDSLPRPIAPRAPVVSGTRQFEVQVIDSNDELLGSDDTRKASPGPGLGRGTIRLFADEQGAVVGWARTFKDVSRFFSYDPRFPSDTRLRKAAMGRPVAGP